MSIDKKQIFKNSLSGFIFTIVNALIVFLTIPVFINKLGAEVFGIWTVLNVGFAFIQLLTNGFNLSLTKWISQQSQNFESYLDIKFNLVIIVLISLMILIIGFLFNYYILAHLFDFNKIINENIKLTYYFLLFATVFILINNTLKSSLDGIHKIDISNYIQLGVSIISWGGILIVLLLNGNLVNVSQAYLISNIIGFFCLIYFVNKHWSLRTIFSYKKIFKKKLFYKHIIFGGKLFFANIITFLSEPLVKLLIARFLGFTLVSYYEIGQRIREQILAIINKIQYPIFPLLSSLNDKLKIMNILSRLRKIIFSFSLLVSVFVIFSTPLILKIWLNNTNSNLVLSVIVIVVGALLFSITVLPIYQFMLAKNYLNGIILLQLNSAILHVGIFILTYKNFGYFSCLLSYTVAVIGTYILSILFETKYLKIKHNTPFIRIKEIILLVPSVLINYLIIGSSINDILKIFSLVFTAFIINLFMYFKFKILTGEELQYIFLDKYNLIKKYLFFVQ